VLKLLLSNPSTSTRFWRLSLSKTALGEALLNTNGNIGWDQVPELVDVTAVNDNGSTDGSGDDIAWESEEVVGNLRSTEILVVKTGDEDGLTTVWVEFLVDGTLREDVHLEGGDIGVDDTSTVLKNEGSVQSADDWNVQLGTTRVSMRSVETAWSEETDSHTRTGTDQGREGLPVGNDDTTS